MSDMHLVLHGLAIKKHGSADAVAGIMGLKTKLVRDLLDQAVSQRRVAEANGAYVLTPLAGVALQGDYSRVHADLRSSASFAAAYERFEVVNAELKQLMTDWQTLDVGGKSVPNDHSSPEHDAATIDRLGALHERSEKVLEALIAGLARLSCYQDKLTAALEKAEDGDIEWVSGAKLESYHTVWFELHEDLLRILGREREE